ncbi:MAG TPA: hypothetical protein VF060_26295 [Trebonia sp.]
MLAEKLGYVRLAEPVRFRAGWEQAASLRLRAGDASSRRSLRVLSVAHGERRVMVRRLR